jgi:hypothetical protein
MLRSRQFGSIGSSDALLNGYNNSIVHSLKRRHGNSPFGNEGDTATPPPLTAESLLKDPAFGTMFNNAVNAAVTAQLSRSLPKALEGALAPITETIGKSLDEKLAALKPATENPPKKAPDTSPETLALQRQMDELKTKLQQSEANSAAISQQAKDKETLGTLKTALTKAKVRPELVDVLANNWFHVDKKITTDESGNVLFKTRGPAYPGAAETDLELPLQRGIDEFCKTTEAQVFLQSPQATRPNLAGPRLPTGSAGNGGLTGNKPPSFADDPGWSARVAAELQGNGIDPGSSTG